MGVSIGSGTDDVMAMILAGGPDFMARVQAFKTAKEAAEAATAELGVAQATRDALDQAVALREDADQFKRETISSGAQTKAWAKKAEKQAAQTLEDAKAQAAAILAEAEAQADKLLVDCRAAHASKMSELGQKLREAEALRAEVERARIEANTAKASALQAESELRATENDFKRRMRKIAELAE